MTKKYNLQSLLLNIFSKTSAPLCLNDIEKKLSHKFNRTSIYRQLEKMLNSKVITKIETNKGAFYEQTESIDSHAHTHCKTCNEVECLEEEIKIKSDATNSFKREYSSIVIEGVCQNCSTIE